MASSTCSEGIETAQLPPCPSLQPEATPARSTAYRRAYSLRAAGATCLLQRVGVHIQYRRGSRLLVDYRTTYHEFFRFERDGGSVIDLHDFCLLRDGWRQAAIEALRRRHLSREATGRPDGEPTLDVRKTFALGFGEVFGAPGTPVADGVDFGFVALDGERIAPARLTLWRENAPPLVVALASPCPAGPAIAGSGTFVGERGWRTAEHFRYRFACLAGQLRSRNGYRPAALPTLRTPCSKTP